MFTPEIAFIAFALLTTALLLVFTGARIQSHPGPTLYHLAGYAGAAFLAYLAHLIANLDQMPTAGSLQLVQAALLATILSFGALTLAYLKKEPRLLTAYWGVALIILCTWSAAAFGLIDDSQSDGQQMAQFIAGGGWIAAVAVAIAAVGLTLKTRPSSKHINRLRYWLIAATLHGAAGLILFFNPPIFYWAGTLALIAGLGLTGYIVLSYQAPDFNQFMGQIFHFIGVRGALAAVLYLGLTATSIFSRRSAGPTDIFLWMAGAAVGLALVIPPLWNFTNQLTTRVVFGKKHRDDKKIVQHFSRSISSALDMQRLGDIVITLMEETFDIERGAIFINERGDSSRVSLRLLACRGTDEVADIQINADSYLINYFRQNDQKYLYQYDIDTMPDFSRQLDAEVRAWLSGLQMELFVPIIRYQNLMGLLAFGPRTQRSAYLAEDRELMIALADQTVLAIDGARLFAQLASINEEMGSLNQQLAGIDQNKTDFLSIASHELRTPLTHVHGYSRMLLDLTEEETRDIDYVKTIVEGIANGSERMKDVLDMMFDVTEANVGEMTLMLGPVNLQQVLNQISGPFLPALDERRIGLDQRGFESLPIIEADETRLLQVLENLLSNAIKYTPDGGLVIVEGQTITAAEIGPAVEITVTDNGIGLDTEHHERIFEKFFRVDDTDHHSTGKTKFKGAGPGLGLTLVKAIAQAHGGRVWVESDGHDEDNYPGSTFHVVIPLQQAAAAPQQEKPKQSEIETVHWSSKKVKSHTQG